MQLLKPIAKVNLLTFSLDKHGGSFSHKENILENLILLVCLKSLFFIKHKLHIGNFKVKEQDYLNFKNPSWSVFVVVIYKRELQHF